MNNTKNSTLTCFCPPVYHGRRCENQTQRVSLTVQLRLLSDFRTIFAVVITLIDDQQGLIESYDQVNYLPMYDCLKKYNIYLLYATRPKNTSTNYTVRIDIYEKISFKYRGSWAFSIQFPFLPVHRTAVQLRIPSTKDILQGQETESCGNHGHYLQYVNTNATFCQCDKGWYGLHCDIQYECNCSPNSLCLGPNLCVCRLGKLGSHCYLKHSKCSCKNGGSCVWHDEWITQQNGFWCICPDGFSGFNCEVRDTQILISFGADVPIPSSLLFHFIRVRGKQNSHIHTTIFKKIPLDQNIIAIYRNDPFHILFIEIEPKIYYLSLLQENYHLADNITSVLTQSKKCLPISEIFNASIVARNLLRRIKLYHIPCQQRTKLDCFYDETHMCICNHDLQQANCFNFNHNMTYNCKGKSLCENEGRCFYDKIDCPTSSMCVCDECSYGSRCQFSTKGFAVSLDTILGYHIKPDVSFSQQRVSIKIAGAIATIMLVCGLVNSVFSIMTFQTKKIREVGCGCYLLVSSYTSAIVFILFALKFYFLIASQMNIITNRIFLSLNCILIDFLIKILVNIIDFLNACVGIERTVVTYQEKKLHKAKNKQIAKWAIILICVLTITTNLQDPIHRRLMDDEEENRTWCIVKYSSSVQAFNSTILLLHFICPFILNIATAFIIVFKVAYQRSGVQKQISYQQHLRQQFYRLKHILISPIILITLAIPRLVISFLSGCMKSPRSPWLFLCGHFISFLPPMSIFIVFVIPSKHYKKEFNAKFGYVRRYLLNRLRNRAT
ncbi:unnamed protein product [Rotaria sp. Silwood2]|nr:unnamed protein product [Rotaria sp. Silwood2]CAF3314117.1 unnamed protein product [Rotaria sp. Silwood2]CAF4427368.1 unnamed protein product [Rotaria sp. Silwood2]CAF4530703.1 unnamed protein product [Rotaria sp. Silwood2]